mmetsp:Transcript_28363/g.25077  ORF Transcript_28363/g.25077 Transcript_28363/m.25077 type:complete len:114 (-) Transcript_28363:76-417(-)
MIRTMNLNNVPVSLNSGVLGCFFLGQSIFSFFWKDGLINFDQYTLFDISILLVFGFCSLCWIWGWFFATKFAQASKVAPLSNLENFFTVVFDIFFFHYNFQQTDVIGLSILGI